MSTTSLPAVVRHLRRVLSPCEAQQVTDAQLLERFIRQRDPAAFELLVWRHQRLVFGVCRRVLRDSNDAEDAFQATFLALVRKAGSIGNRQAVGSWLHQVAYRIALRARAGARRRAGREVAGTDLLETATDAGSDTALGELRPLLDQEVQRLPEKYRGPVVLCYLEGKTYEEAARELGCPKGTLSTRLTRARELLREQLRRRGLTLSSAAFATVLCEEAARAAVPSALVDTTLHGATLLATGQATAGVVSAQVLAMTEGVVKAMFLTKLKVSLGVVVVTLGLLGAGVLQSGRGDSALAGSGGGEQTVFVPDTGKQVGGEAGWQPDGQKAWELSFTLKTKDPVNTLAISPDGRVLVSGSAAADNNVRFWDVATGKEIVAVSVNNRSVRAVAFSPDGKLLATSVVQPASGEILLWDVASRRVVRQFEVKERFAINSVVFSPDGKQLSTVTDQGTLLLWDVTTGKGEKLVPLIENVTALAFSPDGQRLAVAQSKDKSVVLVDVATGKLVLQIAGVVVDPRALAFSPDGRTLAAGGDAKTQGGQIILYEAATGRVIRQVTLAGQTVQSLAFSPDGKVLATAGKDQTVRLWDVATGKELRVLTGHQGPVVIVIFTPDGKRVVSASQDRTVRFWEPARALITKAAKTLAKQGEVGERLEQLLRTLLASKRTDEQVLEALALATFARLPTDVERNFVLKNVSGRKDREEAFRDVLWMLVNSREFRTNVEALQKQLPFGAK